MAKLFKHAYNIQSVVLSVAVGSVYRLLIINIIKTVNSSYNWSEKCSMQFPVSIANSSGLVQIYKLVLGNKKHV